MDCSIVGKSAYISDAIFPEEKEALESELAFKGLKGTHDFSDVSMYDVDAENLEHSREFVDFNFKLDYSGTDENQPVQANIDIGSGEANNEASPEL